MSVPQIYIFAVLAATLSLFIWGRWRYDIVALMALLAVVLGSLIPAAKAFSGFGHPAVITVAAVLVISRAIQNSGLIGWLARGLGAFNRGPNFQTGAVVVLVGILSAFMNNVGALALLLPVVIQTARQSDRSPAELLMPLSFGSLLGGLVTLIGTPPNIIIATYRGTLGDAPYSMFDFTPVGLIIALAGAVFIALGGWRLIPARKGQGANGDGLFHIEGYITEVIVPRKSGLSGTSIGDLLAPAGEGEIVAVALQRRNRRRIKPKLSDPVRIDDRLLLEGSAEAIETIVHETGLRLAGSTTLAPGDLESDDVHFVEAVVTPTSRLVRRTVAQAMFGRRHGLNLLALARQGRPIREEIRKVRLRAGDVLLLQGDAEAIPESLSALGCLPLAERDLALHRLPSPLPLIIFAVAIAVSLFGLLTIPVAFTAAVVALVLGRCISLRELYGSIDWSVIVLLAAMVPVGMAVENSGATALIADGVASLADVLPPWSIVLVILLVAMVLSDVMNNAATAVLMAPLAFGVATRIGVSPDPLLMAVAVGSSCAFLTPIGHQSNVLVMGPGRYRFVDFVRAGLPLIFLLWVVFSIFGPWYYDL